MTRIGLWLTIAATTAGVLALGDAPASARQVGCGDKIKADTTLHHDLVGCPDNGIVIGRDGITLDLNGHTVDGDNMLVDQCPKRQICDAGILIDGHSGVTVRDGGVKQFGPGVLVFDAKHVRLDRLDASRNHFNGVVFVHAARSRLVDSTVSRNGLETDFPGIAVVAGSTRILIAGNRSSGNADLGLYLIESNRNRVIGNDFSNNPEAGMIVDGDSNEIAGNRVARNGDGIVLAGSRNTVARNRISRALRCGAGCGTGISLEDGHDNVIARNEVRGAAETGIRVLTFVPAQHLADNRLRRNRVRDVAGRGVLVGSKAKGTLLARNHVRRSGGNGIGVNNAATTLIRNHANHNGGHGIVAVAGAADGGGNQAGSNRKSPQCVNVFCG